MMPTRAEAKVTATSADDSGKSYAIGTESDGAFEFDLPAGRYVLSATLTGSNAGALATPERVIVTAGENVSVGLYVNFP